MTIATRALVILPALAIVGGCVSSDTVRFSVVSTPPGAQVDVNGISQGVTPLQIALSCSRQWVGVANAAGGWAYDGQMYEVTVYPSAQNPGYSQTKRINPCQARGGGVAELRFDLGLDRVQPRERIEIR